MISASLIKNHTVTYGRKKIEFALSYCDRKTLEIAVYPDNSIVVKAPENADIEAIEQRILKRGRWILKQQRFFRQFHPKTPERSFIQGESHLYLGKNYRLKMSSGEENSVKLMHGFFVVTIDGAIEREKVRQLMNDWYQEKARLHFAESLDKCWTKFQLHNVEKPTLAVKRMKKRWGSLSQSGVISLNTTLIKAPKECIDYVIIHELCHLVHNDHSKAFYTLLEAKIPNWRDVKHKLEMALV